MSPIRRNLVRFADRFAVPAVKELLSNTPRPPPRRSPTSLPARLEVVPSAPRPLAAPALPRALPLLHPHRSPALVLRPAVTFAGVCSAWVWLPLVLSEDFSSDVLRCGFFEYPNGGWEDEGDYGTKFYTNYASTAGVYQNDRKGWIGRGLKSLELLSIEWNGWCAHFFDIYSTLLHVCYFTITRNFKQKTTHIA